MDKYAVCVLKTMTLLVIYQRKKWEICENNRFFLRADQYSYCHAVVKGKPVNLGDGDGMQVPCTLMIEGSKRFIVRL